MSRLSVIIITYNEEKNIRDCLDSVEWADEIVVVDSHSQDRTRQIAASYTKKVYEVDWMGFASTKNYALNHATGDWILWIDADERVTPELATEIRSILYNENPNIDGYMIPRKAYFLGRWIKHCGWYPGYVLRLIRKRDAKFNKSNVHEGFDFDGRSDKLIHALDHYTDRDIKHYFKKYNHYTSLAVLDLKKKNRTFKLSDLLFRPFYAFLKMYFMKLGFLDGIQGFILCVFSASYVFTKYAKLWEIETNGTLD